MPCAGSTSTPSAAATDSATWPGSATSPSSTHQAPSGRRPASSAASCAASRVLPLPPGPVMVSSRGRASRPCSSASSASRPTKRRRAAGEVVRRGVERAQRLVAGAPSRTRARAARGRVSRWMPRSCSGAPAGSAAAAAAETSVWPGRPMSRSRRARAAPGRSRSPVHGDHGVRLRRRRASVAASASAAVAKAPRSPSLATRPWNAPRLARLGEVLRHGPVCQSATRRRLHGHLADVLPAPARDRERIANHSPGAPPCPSSSQTCPCPSTVASPPPNDDISRLARWFFDGDTEVAPGAPFRTSENSARLLRDALGSVGAIIGGRRYFDLADGWGGRHPMGVPVYILTHEPPADWPADSTIHFVTDGLESAVEPGPRGGRWQGHRRRHARRRAPVPRRRSARRAADQPDPGRPRRRRRRSSTGSPARSRSRAPR